MLLKFRNAGLEIRDVVNADGTIDQVPALNLEGEPILDENGNPTYRNKTEIYMNADQFVFSIAGNPAMKLSGLFDKETGKVDNIYLDVNGWVKAYGLEIWGERSEWQNGNRVIIPGTHQMNAKIDSNGNIYGWDAYLIMLICRMLMFRVLLRQIQEE